MTPIGMREMQMTGSTPNRAPPPCVVKVDPEEPDKGVLDRAGSVIRRGGLVAFPTETVYGLGADAFNAEAAKRVFEVKGRPPDNPLIIHVASREDLWLVASSVPEEAWRLVERVWPGPLTIVVPRDPKVPKIVTGGLDTVAVRSPAHPVALGLIEASGTPIAAPSANRSGRPSPTTAEHVVEDLDCKVDLILDAGETFMGVESTIIDFTRDPPVLLRPGPYPIDEVEKILGVKVQVPIQARGLMEAERPLAPGMKYRHYAPETPVVLVDCPSSSLEDQAKALVSAAVNLSSRGLKVAIGGPSEVLHLAMKLSPPATRWRAVIDLGPVGRPEVAARRLFALLRSLDKMDVDVAVFAPVPERGIGLAVMNRLRKAASKRVSC
ncbi:MAG: threonylcarbamoyl-AMP synthase [Desulfurococcales archaeon]|nr:threonylcarbamoyl-AMP synthase [Desulfurococcales archaeon]